MRHPNSTASTEFNDHPWPSHLCIFKKENTVCTPKIANGSSQFMKSLVGGPHKFLWSPIKHFTFFVFQKQTSKIGGCFCKTKKRITRHAGSFLPE